MCLLEQVALLEVHPLDTDDKVLPPEQCACVIRVISESFYLEGTSQSRPAEWNQTLLFSKQHIESFIWDLQSSAVG